MTYPDETVMAASERLMELIEKRDDEEALREREDRLHEYGPGMPMDGALAVTQWGASPKAGSIPPPGTKEG